MGTYTELLQQREALDFQIEAARRLEVADAVAQVKAIVAEYSLMPEDVFSKRGSKTTKGTKVPPKYRDPLTGKTWTGRGRTPRWLDGKSLDDYLIR